MRLNCIIFIEVLQDPEDCVQEGGGGGAPHRGQESLPGQILSSHYTVVSGVLREEREI